MYIYRVNEALIFESFERPFVTAILGPRRVGKSILVSHYTQNHPDRTWVFLNMDSLEERLRIEKGELVALIQEKCERRIGTGNKIWVVIDEAQKCPTLFDQIKLLYDQYKDQEVIKFILTGSAFLTLHQLSAESLAGRIELYHLKEFNLRETLLLQHGKKLDSICLLDLLKQEIDIKQLQKMVEDYSPLRRLSEQSLYSLLAWGGLPEVLEKSETNQRLIYLSNYLQTYLEKDIRAITTITDLNLYQKLIEITAEQTGSVRQDKEIIEALGCSRDTLKKYRGIFLATLMYKEVYPFIGHSLRRLVKAPKGYLFDNGLMSYLTGVDDLSVLEKTGLIGHRFENWFLKELQIWLNRDPKRSHVYYWRTTGGIEVDFVVEKKPLIYPFEVTYSTHIQSKKIKNLVKFLEEEPKAKMGFYIYMGDFSYDEQTRICFVPAWAIL
ncbi:MAG: ATP-binding protein [Proteobacteria bacterium]|nr:ATP-binding protein [Pseudomonadota bacterium]